MEIEPKKRPDIITISKKFEELLPNYQLLIPAEIFKNDKLILKQGTFSLDDTLLKYEQYFIEFALKISNHNLSQAARILGINRTTLYSKMKRLESFKSN